MAHGGITWTTDISTAQLVAHAGFTTKIRWIKHQAVWGTPLQPSASDIEFINSIILANDENVTGIVTVNLTDAEILPYCQNNVDIKAAAGTTPLATWVPANRDFVNTTLKLVLQSPVHYWAGKKVS